MKLYQKISTIIIFALMFLSVLPSQKVLAHDVYFLRVLVNESNYLFEGRVEIDDEITSEKKHKEFKLGNFTSMKNSVSNEMSSFAGGDEKNMIFSFPYKEIKEGKMWARDVNHATDKDAERAYAINNVLVPNLNKILLTLNNGMRYQNPESFRAAVKTVIEASNGVTKDYNGEWRIIPNSATNTMKMYRLTNGKIIKGNPDEEVIYQMPKGYATTKIEEGKTSPVYDSAYLEDVKNISVGMLAAQGLYSMDVKKLTTANIEAENKPGVAESTISKMIINGMNGLRDILGLYSIDEMVFNDGSRMAYGYTHGVMRTSWMDTSLSFYTIFQALAWIALAFSLIKIMFDKAGSTFSVFKQVSLMNSVKNIILTGFLLAASFLFIQALLILNTYIVSIFQTTNGSFTSAGGATSNNASLSQALLSVFYFFIAIYLNFTYIIRGLTIAVLIASAPLFIVSLAFSSKGSQMFSMWAKELVANIFIQSMHAFILGMLLSIQIGATGIETAVIAMALIPLTKMFKKLVIGESGGLMGEVSGGLATAGAGVAAGALASRGKGKAGGKGGAPQGSEIPGAGSTPERREHSVDVPSKTETRSALSSSPEGMGQVAGHTTLDKNGDVKNPTQHSEESFNPSAGRKFGEKAASFAKPAAKIAGGAALAGAGLVVGVGMGAVAGPQGFKAGQEMMGKGAGMAFGQVKDGANSIGNSMVNKYRGNKAIKNGSLLGSERLSNGNLANHRDRNVMKEQGIHDAFKVNDKEIGFTYNPAKMNQSDKESFEAILDMKKNKPNSLASHGIENVTTAKNGMTTVHYNNFGKNQLGMRDVYTTDTKLVETKGHRDKPETSFIYNPKEITPQKTSEFGEYIPKEGAK